jgi:hypothetical protein
VAQSGDVAVNAAIGARIDHGSRAHGLHIPAEKVGEKIGCLGAVAAADLEMNYRIVHGGFLLQVGGDDSTASGGGC